MDTYDWAETSFCYLASLINIGFESPNIRCLEDTLAELEEADYKLLQISVTTEESHYKKWIKLLENIPGVTIHKVTRHRIYTYPKLHRKQYTCYLCIVPIHPEL